MVDHIDLLLTDVDGVLTDGGIYIDSSGHEHKRFHVRDGAGIVAWRKCGLKIGIITGRPSRVTTQRAEELRIDFVEQCGAMHKAESLERVRQQAGVALENIAYIGDDLADLPVLRRVGYPIAVADACPEVRQAAKHVTQLPGGQGAVREVVEHLLREMGRWDEVLKAYDV